MVVATALETATWALVIATACLAVAAGIPAIGALVDYRAKWRRRAALVIPDMHMLRSRINGLISELEQRRELSADDAAEHAEDLHELLGLANDMIARAPDQGMKFTNEAYVVRHLITDAMYDFQLRAEVAREEGTTVNPSDYRDALHNVVATRTSLAAAEACLPASARSINGETFWDRFTRVSHERVREAESELMRRLGT